MFYQRKMFCKAWFFKLFCSGRYSATHFVSVGHTVPRQPRVLARCYLHISRTVHSRSDQWSAAHVGRPRCVTSRSTASSYLINTQFGNIASCQKKNMLKQVYHFFFFYVCNKACRFLLHRWTLKFSWIICIFFYTYLTGATVSYYNFSAFFFA